MATTVPAIIHGYTPTIIDKYLDVAQNGYPAVIRYHDRGGMQPRAIFLHVQQGSNYGSWTWFHQVKASATVEIGKNGDIWRLVHEAKAPWTNGDVQGPNQTATALMNRYGWDPNTWTLSIENEGFSGGLPYTDNQFKSIIWQVWTWLTKYPSIEAIHVLGHYTVNSVTRSDCPDPAPHAFMAKVAGAIAGEVLPTSPDVPTDLYRPAWPVVSDDGTAWDGAHDLTVTGANGPVVFYADKRTVTVNVDKLNCRQWASTTANLVREPVTDGDVLHVLGWVEGEEVDGERRWWVTTYGTRVWSGGTKETPAKHAPVPETPDDGVSQPDYGNKRAFIPVVLNGDTYFPVERDGDDRTRTVTARRDADIRLWAARHDGSPVTGHVDKGHVIKVAYWVHGEDVEMPDGSTNGKWYVLAHGDDPIRQGGRIWSGDVDAS